MLVAWQPETDGPQRFSQNREVRNDPDIKRHESQKIDLSWRIGAIPASAVIPVHVEHIAHAQPGPLPVSVTSVHES